MKIECLIKRKGGTQIHFGHHAALARHYDFQPEGSGLNQPHVCEVDHDDDIGSLLAIKESFRVYRVDAKPVLAIPEPEPVDNSALKNRFDDLLSVDVEGVSNKWLGDFSRDVLGINQTDRPKLTEKMIEFGLAPKERQAPLSMLREILGAMVEQEQRGSDAAAT